jgi:hypothetical protein
MAARSPLKQCRLLEEAESDVAAGDRGIGVKALGRRLGR